MKTLILTILLLIMATSLSGCVVVTERHHKHNRREVCVSQPGHPPIRPMRPPGHNANHRREKLGRLGVRPMLP